MSGAGEVVIAHLSDIHVNGTQYSRELEENVVSFMGELHPDIIVVTGDLTDNGYVHEYRDAVEFLKRLKTHKILVVPGNHDSRNMGYIVFERIFGTRYPFLCYKNVCIQGVDSSEPDVDDGHVGRLVYSMVRENLSGRGKLKIVALHHHLIPVPGTGRERNIPVDAGDFLRVLVESRVGVVLSGHKHVPWTWSLNGMLILHAGTATTFRLKAGVPPSLNIIHLENDEVEVTRVNTLSMKSRVVYKNSIPKPYLMNEYNEHLELPIELKLKNQTPLSPSRATGV